MAIDVPTYQPMQYDNTNYLAQALSNFGNSVTKGMDMANKPFAMMEALKKARLDNQVLGAKAKYADPMEEAKLALAKLQPAHLTAETDLYKGQTGAIPSEIALRNATASAVPSEILERTATANRLNSLLPEELRKEKLNNDWYAKKAQSDINYKNSGGRGLGTGDKGELFFEQLVGKDNPQLNGDLDKIYEASNVLRTGGNALSDGTKINPLSPASQQSYDRVTRGTTTAALVTQGVRANQAGKEIDVLNDYAQKGLEPFGDTYFGFSPAQIISTFENDDESQTKLGRFIASQALQYEAAQNRTKLANGAPGVKATEELMKLSGQLINTKYPSLSYKARKEAARYLDEGLAEGLKARQSVNIGASSLRNTPVGQQLNSSFNGEKKATHKYNPTTGDFEEIK